MKIRRLQVTNFLSFDDLDLLVDPGQTVLVGPNGGGKSNVIRTIDAVATDFDALIAGKRASCWCAGASASAAITRAGQGSAASSRPV